MGYNKTQHKTASTVKIWDHHLFLLGRKLAFMGWDMALIHFDLLMIVTRFKFLDQAVLHWL